MRIVRYQYPRNLGSRSAAVFSPWTSLEEEFDRLVNSTFSDFQGYANAEGARTHPRVDLYEDKESFHFRAELPGMKRDDIQVELGDGVLTIAGERKTFGKDGAAENTTRISRSISVPARVQDYRLAARYEDGVLTVTLPKAEEVKPKRIAIQVK